MRIQSQTAALTFNGDTAQTNALDDYEEGTFTPTFMKMDQQQVLNTSRDRCLHQSGNKVTIWGRVSLTNNGSSSGQASFGGLPFTMMLMVDAINYNRWWWSYDLPE